MNGTPLILKCYTKLGLDDSYFLQFYIFKDLNVIFLVFSQFIKNSENC